MLLLLCAFLCTKMPFSGKLHTAVDSTQTGLNKFLQARHMKDAESYISEKQVHAVPCSLSVNPQLGVEFAKFTRWSTIITTMTVWTDELVPTGKVPLLCLMNAVTFFSANSEVIRRCKHK